VYFLSVWHSFQGGHTAFIAQNCVAAFGTDFKATVQQKGGTEIKEQTCACVQEILARISRSLAQILCESLARFSR
jgi:hypothetical protein